MICLKKSAGVDELCWLGGKISLTQITPPRILKSRDALSPKAVAAFYFLAAPRV
jgi:hypothetical protein